jgi:toluene monooxygenase system ferredoxin subunit
MVTADWLRGSEPFSELPAETLAEIASLARELKFPKGEFVFRIGDHSKDLFILAQGAVDLGFGEMSPDDSGGGAIREAGEVFGWGALVGETNYRTINAICTQETRLIAVDGAALLALLERSASAGFAFLRKLLAIILNRVVSLAAT